MVKLIYGGGLRLMECLRLRVKDIDFGNNQIMVRDAKGMKDRVAVLPDNLRPALQEHLERVNLPAYKAGHPAWARKKPVGRVIV